MGVSVAGDRDLASSLRAATADLADVDLTAVGLEAAQIMASLAPSRTGRLRASIRTASVAGTAVVTFGGPRVPYAQVVRLTHPSRFVERTDAAMETRAARGAEAGWNDIAERHGLT